jgi:hypothetical protein
VGSSGETQKQRPACLPDQLLRLSVRQTSSVVALNLEQHIASLQLAVSGRTRGDLLNRQWRI